MISGIALSTDGALLIAHGYAPIGFITVFKAISGVVLSSRSYSSVGYFNYNSDMRSMVVSSGASPIAYVLSNY